MKKTFIEVLAEKDDEHVYHVRSTNNIHNPETFERIKLAFLPFQIKSFEEAGYKPLSKSNPVFPAEPNSPTYSIKVVTGLPLTKGFRETMAMDARVNIAHLKIEGEEGVDPINEPDEVSSTESQKQVGTSRIGEFMKELQKDRDERKKMTTTREVYESFSTTHRGLESVVGHALRKGYYIVESTEETGKIYLTAEGPYTSRPEGKPYYDKVRSNNSQIVSEETVSGICEVKMLVENIEIK